MQSQSGITLLSQYLKANVGFEYRQFIGLHNLLLDETELY